MKTQMQMYREAERHLADANRAFMDLVTDESNPMTKQDLERLIARWPEKYSRFSGFFGKLADEVET